MLFFSPPPFIGGGPFSWPDPHTGISPEMAEYNQKNMPILIFNDVCLGVFVAGVFLLLLGGVTYLISKLRRQEDRN
jgi:hypothetical protein